MIIDPAKPRPQPPQRSGGIIKDGDAASFADDVIKASMTTPVIVDFWAPWCGPCKQLTPLLEKLVQQANGRVRLVKINIDENQDLAAQLRIQSVPTVYAFVGGRPVDAFVGAQPESKVRAFVDRLTGAAPASPIDDLLELAQEALAAGDAGAGGRAVRPGAAAGPAAPEGDRRDDPRPAGRRRRQAARALVNGPAGRSRRQRRDRRRRLGASTSPSRAESAAGDLAELRRRVAGRPGRSCRRASTWRWRCSARASTEAAIDELLPIVRADRTGTTRRRASSWCASSRRSARRIPLTVAVAPAAVVDPVLMTDDPAADDLIRLLPPTLADLPARRARCCCRTASCRCTSSSRATAT